MLHGGRQRKRGGCAVKVRDLTRGDLLWSRKASRTERGGRPVQESAEAIVPVSSGSLRWEGPNVVQGAVDGKFDGTWRKQPSLKKGPV